MTVFYPIPLGNIRNHTSKSFSKSIKPFRKSAGFLFYFPFLIEKFFIKIISYQLPSFSLYFSLSLGDLLSIIFRLFFLSILIRFKRFFIFKIVWSSNILHLIEFMFKKKDNYNIKSWNQSYNPLYMQDLPTLLDLLNDQSRINLITYHILSIINFSL